MLKSQSVRQNCFFFFLMRKLNIFNFTGKSCPVLQPPTNGAITSFSCGSSFGSQASFTCNKGYQITGSRLRSCRSDGTWSGNTTLCNSKDLCHTVIFFQHLLKLKILVALLTYSQSGTTNAYRSVTLHVSPNMELETPEELTRIP